MSKELLKAAMEGDLDKVKELLIFTDINAKVEITDKNDGGQYPTTALTMSMECKQWRIARYLISSGAKLEEKNIKFYTSFQVIEYGYPFMLCGILKDTHYDEDCFSLLLTYVTDINPSIAAPLTDCMRIIDFVTTLKTDNSKSATSALNYILSEAILRSDVKVMNAFRDTLDKRGFSLPIFKRHLESHTSLHPGVVRNACKYLPVLEDIAGTAISEKTIEEIERLLVGKLNFEVTRDMLPEKLSPHLVLKPAAAPYELVCELICHLMPDGAATPMSAKHNDDIQTDALTRKQNIALFHRILDQHPSEVIARMVAGCEHGFMDSINPAIVLMAQILYFHHEASVDNLPLLTIYQKSDLFKIIDDYCKLKPEKRAKLAMRCQQVLSTRTLQKEIALQKTENKELREQLSAMQNLLNNMSATLQTLTKQKIDNTEQRPTRTRSTGSLFGK